MIADKPNRFRSIAVPLDVDDVALEAVNARLGVPTLTRPVATAEPPPLRAALEKLTIEVPTYLSDAIKREALDRRTTARHVVMTALKAQGFEVHDADLVADGRRSRGKAR